MKKICALLLCLMMLLAAPVLAQEKGVVVQTACNIVKSGEYHLVYCFAQVHNASDEVICLNEGVFQLMNGEELLSNQEASNLWPYFLAPGEDGYLFDIVSFEPDENGPVAPTVTGLFYDVKFMTIDAAYAGTPLPTLAQIAPAEEHGKVEILCEVNNPTDADVFDATVAMGLYSEAGQLLYADGRTLSDVGIPAGSGVLVRFEVDRALAEQWSNYGVTPAQVRATAMYRSSAD